MLCTVKGITEAVAAWRSNGPAASASAAPVQVWALGFGALRAWQKRPCQAVKLKGDVALVVGCHGNVWEASAFGR